MRKAGHSALNDRRSKTPGAIDPERTCEMRLAFRPVLLALEPELQLARSSRFVSNLRIIPLSVRESIVDQKSVSESVGKATRTALRTAARSIISCEIAPPIGGRYPNAATIIPKILNAIPPMAD